MSSEKASQYLKTQIMTASQEQLTMMLYGGAIRFCEQAKIRIEENDREGAHNLLIRAKRIVVELISALKPEVDPLLCERLSALFTYLYRRLIEANINQDKAAVDEVIKHLSELRETWVEAFSQLQQQKDTDPNQGVRMVV